MKIMLEYIFNLNGSAWHKKKICNKRYLKLISIRYYTKYKIFKLYQLKIKDIIATLISIINISKIIKFLKYIIIYILKQLSCNLKNKLAQKEFFILVIKQFNKIINNNIIIYKKEFKIEIKKKK